MKAEINCCNARENINGEMYNVDTPFFIRYQKQNKTKQKEEQKQILAALIKCSFFLHHSHCQGWSRHELCLSMLGKVSVLTAKKTW